MLTVGIAICGISRLEREPASHITPEMGLHRIQLAPYSGGAQDISFAKFDVVRVIISAYSCHSIPTGLAPVVIRSGRLQQ